MSHSFDDRCPLVPSFHRTSYLFFLSWRNQLKFVAFWLLQKNHTVNFNMIRGPVETNGILFYISALYNYSLPFCESCRTQHLVKIKPDLFTLFTPRSIFTWLARWSYSAVIKRAQFKLVFLLKHQKLCVYQARAAFENQEAGVLFSCIIFLSLP